MYILHKIHFISYKQMTIKGIHILRNKKKERVQEFT